MQMFIIIFILLPIFDFVCFWVNYFLLFQLILHRQGKKFKHKYKLSIKNLNIIEMRASLKKPKPKAPTILQEESTKLKQKLELLRQQVTQKKQQKQMNKTATSLQSSAKPMSMNQTHNKLLFQTTKVNMSKLTDNKLKSVLQESKLQSLEEKLREKGVKSFERFLQLNEEQIDEWKDIAVGWRIKLKKQIKLSRQKKEVQNSQMDQRDKLSQQQYSQLDWDKKGKKSQEEIKVKDRDIEQIIKQRKQVQVFVALNRQIQQIDEQQQQYRGRVDNRQMSEQQQDVIIQSLMNVFQPRRGIIKMGTYGTNNNGFMKGPTKSTTPIQIATHNNRRVWWSSSVQQMQKELVNKDYKRYPKQGVGRQGLKRQGQERMGLMEEIGQGGGRQMRQRVERYCWRCFKRVGMMRGQGKGEVQGVRYFCGQQCRSGYQGERGRYKQLGQIIQDVGLKIDHGLKKNSISNINIKSKRQNKGYHQQQQLKQQQYKKQQQYQQQYLQTIDLSIL